MKFKNLYEITFQIKRGSWINYIIHIEAFNKNKLFQSQRIIGMRTINLICSILRVEKFCQMR